MPEMLYSIRYLLSRYVYVDGSVGKVGGLPPHGRMTYKTYMWFIYEGKYRKWSYHFCKAAFYFHWVNFLQKQLLNFVFGISWLILLN